MDNSIDILSSSLDRKIEVLKAISAYNLKQKKDVLADKFVNIRMTQERFNRLKAYADLHNQTITETMYQAIDKLLSEEDKSKDSR